jgi:hypothetical protein
LRAPGPIGTMGERSLHAALKRLYCLPGDRVEEKVEGYFIDVCRDDLLIEIQTRGFAGMKRKLAHLLEKRSVRLVYPVAVEKWIVKVEPDGSTPLSRRKSPKRGRLYDVFKELVSIPALVLHPNFSLEVVLVKEEELRCVDGRGSWRRKGVSIRDHLLLEVAGRELFLTGRDFLRLLPAGWTGPSTNRELAKELRLSQLQAARMTYCLARMQVLTICGKQGNSILYQL